MYGVWLHVPCVWSKSSSLLSIHVMSVTTFFVCLGPELCQTIRVTSLITPRYKNTTPLHTQRCYNLQIWRAQSGYSWNHPDPAPIYHPMIWGIITVICVLHPPSRAPLPPSQPMYGPITSTQPRLSTAIWTEKSQGLSAWVTPAQFPGPVFLLVLAGSLEALPGPGRSNNSPAHELTIMFAER